MRFDSQSARRDCLLIGLAALIAVLPMMVRGCSCGHDFDFHLLNWMEAARQIAHGTLYPQWAYTPAFNAGEPRFVFYPPLSWYLGAVLGLLLTHVPGISAVAGWTATPILFTYVALTGAGLAMYRLAREFAGAPAALLAAVLYLVNPYMLFTAYERTAYGELLAAVWIPLLLLAVLREEMTIPRIAIPLTLLWLTNAPAAVIGSYTLAMICAVRIVAAWRSKDSGTHRAEPWRPLELALKSAAGVALGLGLAAFYVLPAAYERRYVQIAMVNVAGMRIDDNFLFHHTSGPDALAHDLVLHTASIVAVLLLAATAIALLTLFVQSRDSARKSAVPLLPCVLLAIGIAWLLTPWSAFLWHHAPEAGFLQFPWRTLAVLGAVCALAAAGWMERLRLKPWSSRIAALAAAAALTLPAYHAFAQRCFPEDTPATRFAAFQSNPGSEPTDEYTPAGADNDQLKPGDPPFWLADSAQAPAPPGSVSGPAPSRFTVASPRDEELILNLRDYPAWKITRATNGAAASPVEALERDDGLMAVPVPAGTSNVSITYARTFDHTAGDAISVIAIPLLLVSFRRKR